MSRFLSKHQAFFHHIPRTGGTWVSEAIDALGIRTSRLFRQNPYSIFVPMSHALFRHYQIESRIKVKSVCTFVRHPIEYYESVWSYLEKVGRSKRIHVRVNFDWHPLSIPATLWDENFNRWIEKMLDECPAWATRLFNLYTGPEKAEFCAYIGRTEHLVEDFMSILNLLGYKISANGEDTLRRLGRINSSPRQDIEWNPDLKSEVLRVENEIVSRFYGENSRKLIFAVKVPEDYDDIQKHRREMKKLRARLLC